MSTPLHQHCALNGRSGRLRAFAAAIVSRCVGLYLVLYCFPFPLNALPGGAVLDDFVLAAWEPLVRWCAALLGRPITTLPNGSGDTTFNYVQALCMLALAVSGACVWTILGVRGSPTQRAALRTYVRFVLAFSMLSYGLSKALLQQFPPVSTDRLLTTYGESSPMGLLWTTMGYSPVYQAFAGALEILAGVLLLARRTSTLGALVAAGVMTNVLMLNVAFDVPVKLYSAHLLGMSILLLAHAGGRLAAALLTERAIPALPQAVTLPIGIRPWALAAQLITLALMGVAIVQDSISNRAPGAADIALPMPEGTYAVINDVSHEPAGEAASWLRATLSPPGVISIRRTDGARDRYRIESHRPDGSLILVAFVDPRRRHTLRVERLVDDSFLVTIEHEGRVSVATLRRVPDGDFYLTQRAFRWINEFPDNR